MLIGDLTVRPNERVLAGPNGSASVEPLVMALFLELATRADTLVTRPELFTRLWGSLAIGDDNLNRLVAALRRTLSDVGVTSLGIKTVPAAGYTLQLNPYPSFNGADADVLQAMSEARDSWRLSMPQPDHLRLSLLERAAKLRPEEPEVFGHLALLHRHAAEYAEPAQVSKHVRSCEIAARRALDLDPANVRAATALVSVAPLYGRWFEATRRSVGLCATAPDDPCTLRTTFPLLRWQRARTHAVKRRRDRLIVADPLAAQFQVQVSIPALVRRLHPVRMDHAADSAMQLWPFHPAVWTVRLWTFAYTGRFAAAQAMLGDTAPEASQSRWLPFFGRSSWLPKTIDKLRRTKRWWPRPRLLQEIRTPWRLFWHWADSRARSRVYGSSALNLFSTAAGRSPSRRKQIIPRSTSSIGGSRQIFFTPACAHMRPDFRFLSRAIPSG